MNFNFDGHENPENMSQLPFFMPSQPPNPQILEEMMKRYGNGMTDMHMPFQWPMIPSMDFGAFRNFGMMPGMDMDHSNLQQHQHQLRMNEDLLKENHSRITRSSGLNQSTESTRNQNLDKRSYKKKSSEKIKRWTMEESKRYEEFIKKYNPIMQDTTTKRMTKVFLLMSQYVQTKNPSQCRSHHQKFYPKLKALIERELIGRKPLQVDILRMKEEIKYLSNAYKRNCFKDLNEQECIKHVNDMIQIQEKRRKKPLVQKKPNFLLFRLHKLPNSYCEILPMSQNDFNNHEESVEDNDYVKMEFENEQTNEQEQEQEEEQFEDFSESKQKTNPSNYELPKEFPQYEFPDRIPMQMPQKLFDFESMNPNLNTMQMPGLGNFPMPNMFHTPFMPFDGGNLEMNKSFNKFQEEMFLKEQEKLKELMLQFNSNNFRDNNGMMNPPFNLFSHNS